MTANAPKPNTVPIKKHVPAVPATPVVPSTQPEPAGESVTTTPKKPFVRKPHLTDRPFRNDEGLQALHKKLQSEQQRRTRRSRVNIKSK